MAAIGVSMIVPFLWMVSTSFKDLGDVFQAPPRTLRGILKTFIPTRIVARVDGKDVDVDTILGESGGKTRVRLTAEEGEQSREVIVPSDCVRRATSFRWRNYADVLDVKKTGISFARAYLNSLIVAVMVTLGQVATSSMAAYAFARLKFPLRDKLFLGYLATMMIPGAVTMIPVFIILRFMPEILNFAFSPEARWWSSDLYLFGRWFVGRPVGVDSYFALIVPGFFSAYGTFLLRQFFMGLPEELEDAAKIDGCSLFGIYWRITLPLSRPALATLAILTFMGNWRALMWPMVVTHTKDLFTLPVALTSFQGLYDTEWTLLMAAAVMALLPVILVYIIMQKQFVEGIRLGAVKG
ncbi:MAG: carbohydrate ABC transporter permease [Planctomycetes bacterium]|nr:carbohydrate ABC transporter permease [Planctomycetota bacterium]